MGAAIGAQLRQAGHDVAWVRSGRSQESLRRAQEADLRPLAGIRALANECQVIISVCPPGNAVEVAREVSREGFTGDYLDANAISPAAAEWIRSIIAEGGGRFTDGGIVGPPPARAGTTRLFLAGPHAAKAASHFAQTTVDTVVVGDRVGAASAVKMAYAGWTKTTAALLLTLRSYARAFDVEDALTDEWARSLPELADESDRTAATIHRKAWRYVDEMRFISETFAETGLPPGFHEAAADTYAALAGLKDDPTDQDPDDIYDVLRRR
jgi:3-hydroxyisobutyrate dehydrogenase-like beta-hydroxyacid dehydrogenase